MQQKNLMQQFSETVGKVLTVGAKTTETYVSILILTHVQILLSYIYIMLLQFCRNGIFHRDVKPENILIKVSTEIY